MPAPRARSTAVPAASWVRTRRPRSASGPGSGRHGQVPAFTAEELLGENQYWFVPAMRATISSRGQCPVGLARPFRGRRAMAGPNFRTQRRCFRRKRRARAQPAGPQGPEAWTRKRTGPLFRAKRRPLATCNTGQRAGEVKGHAPRAGIRSGRAAATPTVASAGWSRDGGGEPQGCGFGGVGLTVGGAGATQGPCRAAPGRPLARRHGTRVRPAQSPGTPHAGRERGPHPLPTW